MVIIILKQATNVCPHCSFSIVTNVRQIMYCITMVHQCVFKMKAHIVHVYAYYVLFTPQYSSDRGGEAGWPRLETIRVSVDMNICLFRCSIKKYRKLNCCFFVCKSSQEHIYGKEPPF